MYPTSNILYRVFSLRVLRGQQVISAGTMFAIEVEGQEYYVTARHIGEHVGVSGIQVMQNNDWVTSPAKLVRLGPDRIDVAVLALPNSIVAKDARFNLPTGTEGLTLGQEMMFLGFPGVYDPSFGFTLHNGFPVPLVKYARLSCFPIPGSPMWLDGHNNRGFSGSPLCFAPGRNHDLVVAGVVSAYKPSLEPVISSSGNATGLFLKENSGLMIAWNIQHCIDLVKLNPIGCPIG